MTRWSPDTCDCVVEYTDDGKFTAIGVVRKCAKHADTRDHHHHLETVLAHNQRKNQVHNGLIEHLKETGLGTPETMYTIYDDNDDLNVHGHGLEPQHHERALSKVRHHLGRAALKIRS